jgi:succinate dehydrogenase/fumarate reductase flavoprotein subunit
VWHLIRQGYLIEAPSIPQLAAKIGIPVENLVQTVADCNTFAQRGVDPQFHRGETTYDQFYGDSSTGLPNPNLGICDKGPFYALPLYPGNVSSTHGLSTNEHAQVLNEAGKPVSGLYAVGLDSNSIMRGTYPGGGSSIGPGMTFGYRAAFHLLGRPLDTTLP